MVSEAERRAKAKYRKKVKQAIVGFYPKDEELYEWLERQPNKSGYIRELIRKDMEKHQREQ
ncbi:hypothetical protein HGI81_05450 [Olsenella sp. KGMB02461]|nr:hypothetical protein [Olsenella sp. KGMB02461]